MRTLAAGMTALIPLAAAPLLLGAQGRAAPAQTPNAIVGKVTNAAGQPMPDVGVSVVVRDAKDGRFHAAMANLVVRTDEKGEYRIDNAKLGECFVVAFPQNERLAPDGKPNRTGYGVTYHPSAKTAAEAAPVTVNVRGPVTADIRLLPAPLAIVSGTVFDHDGRPAGGQRLLIAHGDNLFGVDARAVTLRPDGTFALAGVYPGTYFFQLREGQWPPPRDVDTPLISGAKVIVDGTDVIGVKVMPIHMVRASGRLVVDAAARAAFDPSGVSIRATPADFEGNPGPERPGTVKDDLTFEFRTWPGPHFVRATVPSPSWTVKAIRYNGADVTNSPIDFKEGDAVTGLEIELARR